MRTDANPALGLVLALPKSRMADDPDPPEVAAQLIRDELLLGGSARLNLATFVTTWLERRCVSMLADLWHAADPEDATGCSTTGSSEACKLAGLALLRRWAARAAFTIDGCLGANPVTLSR